MRKCKKLPAWRSRVFNKHRWLTKRVGYFAHRVHLLFSRKRKQLVCSQNLNENVIMVCFHKGPLVLRYASVMGMLYFSHFFTSFFIALPRICLRAKVRNLVFINCLLLVGIDCVTDKLKASFSWMKNMLFCPQIYSPECWKSYLRTLKFQNFLG